MLNKEASSGALIVACAVCLALTGITALADNIDPDNNGSQYA